MALGATVANVQAMVVLEGFRLVAVGVVVGTLISLAAARALKSMLLVISPRDGVTFVLVPGMLVLVALVACWVPAMRATRIDPSTALREE
jgi:ABC-type lipoprotein release transport system permease subunit